MTGLVNIVGGFRISERDVTREKWGSGGGGVNHMIIEHDNRWLRGEKEKER